MLIEELKKQINNKELELNFRLFQYEDNSFLCYQYVDSITKLFNLEKIYIDSLSDYPVNTNTVINFTNNTSYLYILNIDKFNEIHIDTNLYKNLIIITKSIKYFDNFKLYITNFPKLEKWHIFEYIKSTCPQLNQDQVTKIYNYSLGNIYKIENELSKLKLFDKEKYNLILQDQFNNSFNIFKLSDAIIKKDLTNIKNVYLYKYDINSIALLSILIKNFRNIIQIQMNPRVTASQLNINYGQFLAIKNNINYYTNEQLINIIYFLNNIDKDLKLGLLNFNNETLLTYIINNIMIQ